MRLDRRLAALAVVVLVGAGVLAARFYVEWGARMSAPEATRSRAEPPEQKNSVTLTEKQAATIRIAAVAEKTFNIVFQAIGAIDFNQNLLVQVFTPYQGRIISAYPNAGDRVDKDQILFTIDSPDLLQAEANLITAAGVLTLQTRALARVRDLLRIGGVAQKDVDQATSDQQAAEGALKAARDAVRIFGKTDAEIDRIVADRKTDSRLIVKSPISGFVTARAAAPGLFVQPGVAPAPFVVADTSTMWMIANVTERESTRVRVGQPVRVRISAIPDREFEGAVTVVGASVDPATRRVLVRSEVRDSDRLLRAGMFASFTIAVGEPARGPALPSNGVVREGDGSMVAWTTEDGRTFRRREIRTGVRQDGDVQILDGLKTGEQAVVDGAIFLSNLLLGGPAD